MIERYGFEFNGKHLYNDFNCYVNESEMSPPNKKEIRKTVPYMNGYYNFSSLYGGLNFESREIVYRVDVIGRDIAELNDIKSEIASWLLNCGEMDLYDDMVERYHFKAECINISESDSGEYSELTIEFIAYPFKISNELYEVKYSPSDEKTLVIYNTGDFEIIPIIECVSSAWITYGTNKYALGEGKHNSSIFTLKPGENTFTVQSSGEVIFQYRTEVL